MIFKISKQLGEFSWHYSWIFKVLLHVFKLNGLLFCLENHLYPSKLYCRFVIAGILKARQPMTKQEKVSPISFYQSIFFRLKTLSFCLKEAIVLACFFWQQRNIISTWVIYCIFIGHCCVPLLHHEDMILYRSLLGMTGVIKWYQVVW